MNQDPHAVGGFFPERMSLPLGSSFVLRLVKKSDHFTGGARKNLGHKAATIILSFPNCWDGSVLCWVEGRLPQEPGEFLRLSGTSSRAKSGLTASMLRRV